MSLLPCRLAESLSLDNFQIVSEAQLASFQDNGPIQIDWIRFESAYQGGALRTRLDFILSNATDIIPLLGLVWDDGLKIPSSCAALSPDLLRRLEETARHQVASVPQQHEMRPLSAHPRLGLDQIHSGSPLPGAWDYSSILPRIDRIRSLLTLDPDILICQDSYAGMIAISSGSRTSIHRPCLEADTYPNTGAVPALNQIPNGLGSLACMDILSSVPDPQAWLREASTRLAPSGTLHLTIPLEDAPRTELSCPPQSMWNHRRLEALASDLFSEVEVRSFDCSLLGDGIKRSLYACLAYPREHKRQRIVVQRDYAMGDVLWTTPIVHQLRLDHPGSTIAVKTRCMDVFRGNPDVDLVLGERFEPTLDDRLIDLDFAYERRRNLHPLDAYAQVAEVTPSLKDPVFHPNQRDLESVRAQLIEHLPPTGIDHLIALHMAASSPDRVWPRESWKELILSLLDTPGIGIVLVGSGKDDSLKDLGLPCSERIVDLVRQLDLSGTAACLSWCDALVCLDSGLCHLAAAVATPPIALFSMARPESRLPFKITSRGLLVTTHCRGCLDQLPAEAPPLCRYGKATCLETISSASILQALREVLQATRCGAWASRLHAGRKKQPASSAKPLLAMNKRWQDHRIFDLLRTAFQLIRNFRKRAAWASRKDLRL